MTRAERAEQALVAALEAIPPEDRDRTRRYLAGELPEGPKPERREMGELDKVTGMRLPPDMLERAAALADRMAEVPEIAAHGKPTRSLVLRLAVLEGLKVLERRHKERSAE